MMEELLAALFSAFMGSMFFLYYRSIKDKKGDWLQTNRKQGAIVGIIVTVITTFIALFRAYNKI